MLPCDVAAAAANSTLATGAPACCHVAAACRYARIRPVYDILLIRRQLADAAYAMPPRRATRQHDFASQGAQD